MLVGCPDIGGVAGGHFSLGLVDHLLQLFLQVLYFDLGFLLGFASMLEAGYQLFSLLFQPIELLFVRILHLLHIFTHFALFLCLILQSLDLFLQTLDDLIFLQQLLIKCRLL